MKKTAEEIYDDLRKRHKGVWSQKDTAVMAANIYADQFKPKWIPVEERLPELYMRVNICEIVEGLSEPIVLQGSLERNRWRIYGGATAERVTHWMPLPSAPERKEEVR